MAEGSNQTVALRRLDEGGVEGDCSGGPTGGETNQTGVIAPTSFADIPISGERGHLACQTTSVGVTRKKAYLLVGDELEPRVDTALDASGMERGAVAEASVAIVDLNDQSTGQSLVVIASRLPTIGIGVEGRMVDAVNAGCRGFLPADCDVDSLAEAVSTVAAGGAYIPPALLGPLLRLVVDRNKVTDVDLSDLTEREREVFHLAADGARKEEIGERLFISPATARTHLQRVYKKLGVHSQSELMALSRRNGSEP